MVQIFINMKLYGTLLFTNKKPRAFQGLGELELMRNLHPPSLTPRLYFNSLTRLKRKKGLL